MSDQTDYATPNLHEDRDLYLLRCRDSFMFLIGDAIAEAQRAMVKFPQPNYVISKFAEESGEVVKAAIHCAEGRETADNLQGEMRQAIAMLYRLWVEGDQVHGLPPVAPSNQDVDDPLGDMLPLPRGEHA